MYTKTLLQRVTTIQYFFLIVCSVAAQLVPSLHLDPSDLSSRCDSGHSINYTIPMAKPCSMKYHPSGKLIQTIPKLIPMINAGGQCGNGETKFHSGHRVCRFPDCIDHTCVNGWCEETNTGFICHCSQGFSGKRCQEVEPVSAIHTTEETIATSGTPPDVVIPKTTPATNLQPTTVGKGRRKIFMSDRSDEIIYMADLEEDELNFTVLLSLDASISAPLDLTFNKVDQKLYWTDTANWKIWRADLVQRIPEEVSLGDQGEPWGIAISELTQMIYVSYRDESKITHSVIGNASSETVLVNDILRPLAVGVDDHNRYLYWTRTFGIYRIPLDRAGDVETVSSAMATSALIIDDLGQRIFFAGNQRKIYYLDVFDSFFGDPVDINGSTDSYKCYDLGIVDHTLYILDRPDDIFARLGVFSNYREPNPTYQFHAFPNWVTNRIHVAVVNTP